MLTRSNPAPFVILFQGRSGSTYFVEGLSAHPAINCELERLVGLRKFGNDAQLKWASNYFATRASQVRAIGFKTKLDDILDPNAFRSLLRDHNASVILLTRNNLPKVVISWINSERIFEATGDWNLYPPAHPPTPFEVDLLLFERRLGLVEQGRQRLRDYVGTLALSTLEVFYEDFLLDEAAAFRRVFDFLGVPPAPVAGNCVKATNDDLRNVLLNFEQLRNQYLGTMYLSMIEEVLLK